MSLRRKLNSIRRKFGNAGLILLYHRVANLDRDPQLLAVTPARFSEHLDILRARANVCSLRHMLNHLGSGLPPRSVAITFDDGYADNLHEAKPILETHDMPATVFVTTGVIGGTEEFWWDEVDRLFLTSQDAAWNVEQPDSAVNHKEYRRWCDVLRRCGTQERAQHLNEVRESTGNGAEGRATHRAMNADEVRQLVDGGLIDVGAHTVNHPVLSNLPASEQYAEAISSRRTLEEITGQTIHAFAYPYGAKADYNRASVEAAQSAGFTSACSNFDGLVWANTNRFELPRVLVRNWDANDFGKVLDAVLT